MFYAVLATIAQTLPAVASGFTLRDFPLLDHDYVNVQCLLDDVLV